MTQRDKLATALTLLSKIAGSEVALEERHNKVTDGVFLSFHWSMTAPLAENEIELWRAIANGADTTVEWFSQR